MEKRPYSFIPSDNELFYLEDNKVKWSEWCHHHLSDDMGLTKKTHIEKITNHLYLIIFGLICYVVAFTVIDIYVYICLNIGALFLMVIGFYLVIREIRTLYLHKKNRRNI